MVNFIVKLNANTESAYYLRKTCNIWHLIFHTKKFFKSKLYILLPKEEAQPIGFLTFKSGGFNLNLFELSI